MAVTVDLSTPIGKCRAYLKDTDKASVLWQDAEITFWLAEAGGSPKLAAILALESECVEQARGAAVIKLGTFGDNEQAAYESMRAQAEYLRKNLLIAPSISAPAAQFTTSSQDGAVTGSMELW